MIDAVAELISLASTGPTLMSAVLVLLYWKGFLQKTFRTNPSEWKAMDMFVVGICLAFAGDFMDNLYWGLAWTAEYLNSPIAKFLFNKGVYSNIPFRQASGAFAGYIHVRGCIAEMFYDYSKPCEENERFYEHLRRLNQIMMASIVFGIVYVIVLVVIRFNLLS